MTPVVTSVTATRKPNKKISVRFLLMGLEKIPGNKLLLAVLMISNCLDCSKGMQKHVMFAGEIPIIERFLVRVYLF